MADKLENSRRRFRQSVEREEAWKGCNIFLSDDEILSTSRCRMCNISSQPKSVPRTKGRKRLTATCFLAKEIRMKNRI